MTTNRPPILESAPLGPRWPCLDPFLFCAYHDDAYPAGKADIKLVKIVIPPNTKLATHTHPMPNIAYVHSGSLTVKSETDNREQQLKPGDFLAEMVNKPHYGYTGSEAVELYVVYCGVTGQELAINTP